MIPISREVLKSYTFRELKSLLKDLRKRQKEARLNLDREYYFNIYDDIQKVTVKMRNIIRKRNKLKIKSNISNISKEF